MKLSRTFAIVYGSFCYLLHWLATFYLIGFIGNLWWPKTIDTNRKGAGPAWAVVIDVVAVMVFVLLHWMMARPWFKSAWSRWIPQPIERSTYVLTTCLTLGFLFLVWQPILGDVWLAGGETETHFLRGVYLLGWALAIYSTFPINHWELFGLRQTWLYWSGKPYTPPKDTASVVYRVLPHPIFLGYAISIWAAPRMSWGHFLLSSVLALFLLVDLRLAANEH